MNSFLQLSNICREPSVQAVTGVVLLHLARIALYRPSDSGLHTKRERYTASTRDDDEATDAV